MHEIYTHTDPHEWGYEILRQAHERKCRLDQFLMEIASRLYDQFEFDEVVEFDKEQRKSLLRVVRDVK